MALSKSLPLRSLFKTSDLFHIHWHAKYGNANHTSIRESGFTKEKSVLLFQMLQRSFDKWNIDAVKISWTNYYETEIVSSVYLESKLAIVSDWMRIINPKQVIDIGANNGRFSILASTYATKVIALEADHHCIGNLRAYIKKHSIGNIGKYIDYLQYGNSMLLALLDKHLEMAEKIVVISGDHGPRFPFQKNRSYKFSPYMSVHTPHAYATMQCKKLNYILQLPEFLLKHILN